MFPEFVRRDLNIGRLYLSLVRNVVLAKDKRNHISKEELGEDIFITIQVQTWFLNIDWIGHD